MGPRIAQAVYDTSWTVGLPAVLARFWWRGRAEPAYRQAWLQRLGHWSVAAQGGADAPRIWVHAVSLGETRAAQPLIQALRQRLPGMQLLLTTGTATGLEAGRDLLQPGDLHGWVPLDTPWATQRFFETLRPQVGVLMETETWPNLLRQAQRARVPVVLANARLSERSLRKGLKWAHLTRPMMERLAAACAQTDTDAHHLERAGVPRDRISVSGNLKYELHPSADLLNLGRHWASPPGADRAAAGPAAARRIVMAASWREGEDLPLLQAWQTLRHAPERSDQPPPLLLMVPRHPQRFDEVQSAMRSAGLVVSRRSTWGADGPSEADWQADAWLGDSLGEMPAYYAAADVALLGGSFAPLGGQNLIEAAACACPIVMGPHTFNFEDAAQRAQQEGAALRAADLDQALSLALTISQAQLQRLRSCGLALVAAHAGAAQRQAHAVVRVMQSRL